MLKMQNEDEDPSHKNLPVETGGKMMRVDNDDRHDDHTSGKSLMSWIKSTLRGKPDTTLRETIEEYIEENILDDENGVHDTVSEQEKILISNILKLRDTTVIDVMVPRANIIALDVETTSEELLTFLSKNTLTRIPVYKEKLDDIVGAIHIKDILGALASGKELNMKELIRDTSIISPSMSVVDLLLEMRQSRKQIAMVVDEFGGIDGLVTIGDILEEIVGQIDDEHDLDDQPKIKPDRNGGLVADARVEIDEFEDEFGEILNEEQREESDTLGGLMFHMAGRVPARGEVLTHESGTTFEVLEADPRRVSKVRITNIPGEADTAQ